MKVGGNYAASLLSGEKGHEMGYSNIMYLDAAEHKYIEECGAANFFGIKDGKYITPKSPSVLPSITNMSLRQITTRSQFILHCKYVNLFPGTKYGLNDSKKQLICHMHVSFGLPHGSGS